MKISMDIFCSSPASTATRSGHSRSHRVQESYNNSSTSSSSSITPRLIRVLSTPCTSSSDLALNPKPVNRHEYEQLLQKQKSGRKSTSSCKGIESGVASDKHLMRRKSSADVSDVKTTTARSIDRSSSGRYYGANKPLAPGDGGSYYCDDDDRRVKLEISKKRPPLTLASRSSSGDENNNSSKPKSPASGFHRSTDRVVVLWVSLHCKGCEAKVRKHISKMEGVKSFSTDWATKRVTIISSMDPHDVLASVSRVKYAQFWPSSSSSSSSHHYYSTSSSSTSPSTALLTITR